MPEFQRQGAMEVKGLYGLIQDYLTENTRVVRRGSSPEEKSKKFMQIFSFGLQISPKQIVYIDEFLLEL